MGFVRKVDAKKKVGGFKLKKEIKLETVEQKIDFLNKNIGKLNSQKLIDAVVSMTSISKKQVKLSEHQIKYLDYMISVVL